MDAFPMTRLRCAILDDYFNLALTVADWSKISHRADVTVFNHPFASEQAAAGALADFDIVCAMRERTAFPNSLFAALPTLKLLITSGMRNAAIDIEAARERGVVVCGTQYSRDPTAALTMGLILELTRGIGRESAHACGRALAGLCRHRDRGPHAGRCRARQARQQGCGAGESVRHERDRLESQPHG
jgi:phosphoglycerate dehydrogenase-like enzyme